MQNGSLDNLPELIDKPVHELTMAELLQVFGADHAEKTRERTASSLKRFGAFINAGIETAQDRGKFQAVGAATIRLFLTHLRGQGLSPNTIRHIFSRLNRFYGMLESWGMVSFNPVARARLRLPGGIVRPTRAVSAHAVRRIFEANSGTRPRDIKRRAILALFFGTGIRRGELCAVTLGDIRTEGDKRVLYIKPAKTISGRDITLAPWVCAAINEYLASRIAQGETLTESTLFYGGGVDSLRDLWDTAMRKAGLAEKYKPHDARATFITRLLDQGYNHRQVQRASGHSMVSMVERYDKRRLGVAENPSQVIDYSFDVEVKT